MKDKRMFLRALKDRIRNNFNVAVSETDELDKWQRSQIGIATVANDKRYINTVLDKIVDLTNDSKGIELLDHQIEII